MILDAFDREVLEATGSPEDIMREFYGKRIGKNNSAKYRQGIIMHLKMKQKITEPQNELNERVILGNGQITTKRMMLLSESDSNDSARIMQLNGFDPLKWELVSCKVRRNDWDVTMKLKDEDGEYYSRRKTNHQYRIELTVKPIQSILSTEYIQKVFEELEPPEITKVRHKGGSMLLELPIMDLHLGKLAWGKETGQDYDLKIAERLYKETILDILGKVDSCNFDIEKIVFPVGQDFFHVDSSDNKTTAGTQVDVDSRWEKMYAVGINLLVWAIEQFRQIAPVDVMYVPGNHDTVLSYCAVYTLHARYQNCDSVTVDISPTTRKYIHYGVNLIGYSHGKEGKRIEHLMQQERPKEWGNSVYREWHLGDLHHETAREIGGVKIRRISSITATDAWHAEKGYRAVRMAQAFIWDKEKGRQFVIDSNIDIDEQVC